ncbi:MAG TPA: DMT family transporter [Metabacillus sp.]|nr:DMT family transporter [Metabacillus sp.]
MKKMFADGSLLFVAFIWGATFVVVQNAIQFLPPNLFNGIRFLLAAIILSMFVFKSGRSFFSIELIKAGTFLGFFLFIGYSFQTVGLIYTTSSKAGFITGLSVMIVPILAIFFLKEQAKPIVFIGASIGTVGLYFLTLAGISQINFGDLLVFICAIGFAFHIVFTSKFTEQHPALPLTIIQLFTVSLLSFLSSFLIEKPTISINQILHQDVIIALSITSIFATALAFYIQTKFQQFTSAARVAIIFAMEPVFAALTAYFVLEERLSIYGFIGCCFIFMAMIMTELPKFFPFKHGIKQTHSM